MIIEDNLIINENEKNIIKNQILSSQFPFYWHPYQVEKDNNPYFQHVLIERNTGEIKSYYINFFDIIIKRFLKKNNINFNRYLRACINLTYPNNKDMGEPHVDHIEKHSSIIIYLNNASGTTILYDYIYNENKNTHENYELFIKNKKILKEIQPEQFKLIFIKNVLYHCQKYPSSDRRVIAIFTFI
jgi:hypothetical protein